MNSSSMNEFVTDILKKPNKTVNDLQQIIDRWHHIVLKNEDNLLQYAKQLDQKHQLLNKTTESFIQTENLLLNLEESLKNFQISVQTLTKYNDELENNIQQLNSETKILLPNMLSISETEQNRSETNKLMESVDNDLDKLNQTMKQLYENLQINADVSVFNTVDSIQKCFDDIHTLERTMKQYKL